MRIYVNESIVEIVDKERVTINIALKIMNIKKDYIAVIVNSHIIKRDNWNNYEINNDDKVEILEPIVGG